MLKPGLRRFGRRGDLCLRADGGGVGRPLAGHEGDQRQYDGDENYDAQLRHAMPRDVPLPKPKPADVNGGWRQSAQLQI